MKKLAALILVLIFFLSPLLLFSSCGSSDTSGGKRPETAEERRIRELRGKYQKELDGFKAIQSAEDRLKTLAQYEKDKNTVLLVKALDDADVKVRLKAVEALDKVDDKRTVPYLAKSMEDRSPKVRVAAAKVLKRFDCRHHKVFEMLNKALNIETDKEARLAIEDALLLLQAPQRKKPPCRTI